MIYGKFIQKMLFNLVDYFGLTFLLYHVYTYGVN